MTFDLDKVWAFLVALWALIAEYWLTQ